MNFRKGNAEDLEQLKELGIVSWTQFKKELTSGYWDMLSESLNNLETYAQLLEISECVVCENESEEIIGMAFLTPSGNPNHVYEENWCHLRFVSVAPDYRGKRIGEALTRKCVEIAMNNNEGIMALHTSEIMKSARHIYEKLGFMVLREIEPQLGVRYWVYTLDLSQMKT